MCGESWEASGSSLDVWRSQAWVLRRAQMLTRCRASHLSLSEIVMIPNTAVLEGTGPGANDPETRASQNIIIKCAFPLCSTNKGVFFQSASTSVLQAMGWEFVLAWLGSCPPVVSLQHFLSSVPYRQYNGQLPVYPVPLVFLTLWVSCGEGQPSHSPSAACWFQSLS